MSKFFSFSLVYFLSASINAAIPSYSQDFESLTLADTEDPHISNSDLDQDGWEVYGAVWNARGAPPSFGSLMYEYSFPDDPLTIDIDESGAWGQSPNHTKAFAAVYTGDPTKDNVGSQYLNIFSDYDNGDHATGSIINAIVAKRFTIASADIGKTVTFSFDSKRPQFVNDGAGGDSSPAAGNDCPSDAYRNDLCTAYAFIKTIDPSDGYAETNYIRALTSDVSQSDWETFELTLELTDPLLEGQELQIGFETFSTLYGDTGVYYDNLSIEAAGGSVDPNEEFVPFPATALLILFPTLLLLGIKLKK